MGIAWVYDGAFEFSAVKSVDFARVDDLSVYPNPASDWVTVSGLRDAQSISLFDAQGREITSLRVVRTDSMVRINVKGLKGGTYYLFADNQTMKISIN